ncbi:MAG: CAP domain-containing protein [Methylobacteriaceae bacterium]|nr:CAP domain-containing protein [Methylobacteriaceae bacterium]
MRLRRFLAALPLLALAHCAGGDDLVRVLPPEAVTTTTGEAGEAARLISEYRHGRGLGPVVADGQLNEAALVQARAVAEAGRLSHGAFASRMAGFRIAGYSAENLSAGSPSVAGAIARWKASPGHDENLLLPQARRIGLARADSPGHGYGRYWALVLAQ